MAQLLGLLGSGECGGVDNWLAACMGPGTGIPAAPGPCQPHSLHPPPPATSPTPFLPHHRGPRQGGEFESGGQTCRATTPFLLLFCRSTEASSKGEFARTYLLADVKGKALARHGSWERLTGKKADLRGMLDKFTQGAAVRQDGRAALQKHHWQRGALATHRHHPAAHAAATSALFT